MLAQEVIDLIRAGIPDAQVLIEGEDCSFSVVVISESFAGENLVKKQQRVLATVKAQLATGALHAMSVKAYTPGEWAARRASQPEGLTVLQ